MNVAYNFYLVDICWLIKSFKEMDVKLIQCLLT